LCENRDCKHHRGVRLPHHPPPSPSFGSKKLISSAPPALSATQTNKQTNNTSVEIFSLGSLLDLFYIFSVNPFLQNDRCWLSGMLAGSTDWCNDNSNWAVTLLSHYCHHFYGTRFTRHIATLTPNKNSLCFN
jgi:hypothetical protein